MKYFHTLPRHRVFAKKTGKGETVCGQRQISAVRDQANCANDKTQPEDNEQYGAEEGLRREQPEAADNEHAGPEKAAAPFSAGLVAG